MVYEVNFNSCASSVPYNDPTCGQTLTNASKLAESFVSAVGAANDKIAKTVKDLIDSVDRTRRVGCYSMDTSPPKTSADILAQLCGTLAQTAQLNWLALGAAANGQ